MGKQIKTQWDFGELFPPEQTRKVLSVTELTWQVKRLLEQQVGSVWVTGEVTNLRAQSSGHIYFTLKDAGAQLSCVLFRGEASAHRELLEDGRKLLLQGDVTVYEARGQYQLIVHSIELLGVGALQIAFEKLKQKLQGEGLFAPERKRPLPQYPRRIGLVTSPAGAAIRDVLHVVRRRHPALEIILAPCRVQGEGAALEIAEAIRQLNEFNASGGRCNEISIKNFPAQVPSPDADPNLPAPALADTAIDLILVTRGGGSLEDLWAFNEEAVARAIFESAIPIVSAIGHEIDFTISDFVADVRAATPSAAAEIITEGVFSSREFLSDAAQRMRQLAGRQIQIQTAGLEQINQRLARVHPRRRFNDWFQLLDDLQTSLLRRALQGTREQRATWKSFSERLQRVRPSQLVKQRREQLERVIRRSHDLARQRFIEQQNNLATLAARLRLLGPEQVLNRGYSITTDAATGSVLRNTSQAKPGQRLKTRLKTGAVFSQVEKTDPSV